LLRNAVIFIEHIYNGSDEHIHNDSYMNTYTMVPADEHIHNGSYKS